MFLEIYFSSLRNIRVWWSVRTIQFLLSALAIYSRYNIECGDPSRLWRMHLPPFSVSEENPVEGVFAYRCVEWCASAENAHTARLLRMIGLHIHTATPECCCVVMTTRRIGSTPGIPCCLREWQLYSTLYLGPLALASSLRLHIWFWCRVRMSHMNRAFRIPLQYLISARGGNVSCASESTFSTVYCLHMYECVFSWILEFHFSCRAAEQSLGWHFNKWHLDLNLNLDIKKHILLLQTYATLRRCADCCIYSLFFSFALFSLKGAHDAHLLWTFSLRISTGTFQDCKTYEFRVENSTNICLVTRSVHKILRTTMNFN